MRKRSSPLPEPQYDPNDKAAVKRVKNTLAARKSRQKKADRIAFLEARVEELQRLEPEVLRLSAELDKWKKLALSK